MIIDATFWVAVSFFIFLGALVYFKIPQKITEALNSSINSIKNEVDNAELLKDESKNILSEYENIIKSNLSDNFYYYFDDLNMYDVEEGVNEIYKDLKSAYPNIKYYSFWTYGWIGQYEKLHKIGLITTFDISIK